MLQWSIMQISWLFHRYLGDSHVHASLEKYRTLIDEACWRGDYLEAVPGSRLFWKG
jgi:hypothetical protein